MSIELHGTGRESVGARVAAIWRDVLGAADAPGGATFFDLGGQSISAVRIAARIEDDLGVVIDVGLLFDDPDLATLVATVEDARRAAA